MGNKKELVSFLAEKYLDADLITINVLESNKWSIGSGVMLSQTLKEELGREDIGLNGFNDKEIYLLINGVEITLQHSPMEILSALGDIDCALKRRE